jgi:hypothetical protein
MSIIKLSPYILDSTLDFTFNNVTATGNIVSLNANLGNAVVANYHIGSGNNLSNIQGANVSGQVGNALVSGTVYTAAQPNITSVGTLTSLNVNGTLTAVAFTANTGVFTGNGNGLSSIVGANVTGQVANALVAGTVTTAAQPNITSVGTLTSLNVNGTLTAVAFTANTGVFTGNGNGLSSIVGANVTGQVGNALVSGTVYTAAQPNITSVGTLTSLVVTGNITAGNANLGNLTTSNYFAGVLTTAAQPNITSVGTLGNLTVTSNISAGNILTNNLLYANGVAWSFGSGTPGGSNTYIQFNDGSTFGGNAGLIFNKSTTTLTANNFVATTTANLGAAGNVKITGGSSGQYLKTDGAGNLSWSSVSASGGGASVTVSATAPATPSQGDLWLDSESGDLNVYFGGAWGDVSPGASQLDIQVNNFTGDGVTSTFTLTVTPGGVNYTIVTIGGVVQPRNYYTITNAVINFGVAPATGVAIEVSIFGGGASPIGLAGSVTNGAQPNITSVGTLANLTATGNTTLTGNLTLNGSGLATTGKAIAMAIVFGF